MNPPSAKSSLTKHSLIEFAKTRMLQEFELVFKEFLKAKEIE